MVDGSSLVLEAETPPPPPLDVFATSSGGVPYPTGAALDPFIGDLMLAGHRSGVFPSANAFP